jgi:hypothetical protein
MSHRTNPQIAQALDDVMVACMDLAERGCEVRGVTICPEEHRRPRVRISRPPHRAGLGCGIKTTTARSLTYAAVVHEVQVEWEVER